MNRSFALLATTAVLTCIALQLAGSICAAARPTAPVAAKMRILWIEPSAQCAGDMVFRNISAEVDELAIDFQILSPSSVEESPALSPEENLPDTEAIFRQLAIHHGDAVLWFSCATSQLRLYSALLGDRPRQKTITPHANGEVPIESVTAVVRNWLEGLLPVWEKAQRDPQPAEPPKNASGTPLSNETSPYGNFNPETTDYYLGQDPPDFQTVKHPQLAQRVFTGLGLLLNAPDTGRLVPGGYGSVAVRIGQRWRLGASFAVMKEIRINQNDITSTIRHYPLTAFGAALLPIAGFALETRLSFELSPVKRTADVENRPLAITWKPQPSLMGQFGVAIPLGARVYWGVQLGIRVILYNTVLQIQAGDETITVYDPWRVQPLVSTGIEVGIF